MARSRDEAKRNQILLTSKSLFASKGFFNTSIADIVRETGFPVGTIYTYFQHKEDIIQKIVEEGWEEFYTNLKSIRNSNIPPVKKLRAVIEEILPKLLQDVDLINILLTEAIQYTAIEDKIEKLTDTIDSILQAIPQSKSALTNISRGFIKTSIVVFFLGILHTAKISETKVLGITNQDIIDFTKSIISQFIGVGL